MNIGIYIHEYDPSIGGGFTFVDTIFHAFLADANRTNYHYTIFCTASAEKSLTEKIKGLENVNLAIIPRKTLFGSAITAIKHFIPLLVPVLQRFSPLQRTANRRKIGLIWFVGGLVYDTIDIPYVATVWDLQHRTHPWFPEVSIKGRWEYRENVYSRFLRRASHIITGTTTGRDQLINFYQIPQDRISIIPHPVPALSNIKAVSDDVFKDSTFARKPFLFYPAQFWAHKNHVNLLYALSELKVRHHKDVNLVLTGSDKGNLAYVKSIALKLGVTESLFALGFVSTEQLAYLYQKASALAYASFSGPENLPPLEAFSLGCPVVNSDYPGAREQLGEAALYMNPHDPADMAFQINRLLDDQQLKSKLIELGKEQMVGRTAKDFIGRVFNIFRNFEVIRRTWP